MRGTRERWRLIGGAGVAVVLGLTAGPLSSGALPMQRPASPCGRGDRQPCPTRTGRPSPPRARRPVPRGTPSSKADRSPLRTAHR